MIGLGQPKNASRKNIGTILVQKSTIRVLKFLLRSSTESFLASHVRIPHGQAPFREAFLTSVFLGCLPRSSLFTIRQEVSL